MSAAAAQRFYAYFQLLHGERLDEIVVGAGLKALDLVLELIARREHQHRRRALDLLAQLAADREAVEGRQHEVEDNDVVVMGRGKVQPGDAVGGIVERVALGLEIVADVLGDVSMVFYYQYPHLLGHPLAAHSAPVI